MKKISLAFQVFVFLTLPVFLSGCGETSDEEVGRAILKANQLLTTRQCNEAIRTLESVGRRNDHGPYLFTLASAYACRAGYSELRLFADDLSKIGDPSLFGGFTRFTGADSWDDLDSSSYFDLREAIEILKYAGGQSRLQNPSTQVLRSQIGEWSGDIFGSTLYMSLVQLGRYLFFLGDVDDLNPGVKQRCLLHYDDSDPILVSYFDSAGAGAGGSECESTTHMTANSALGTPGDYDVEMICQGIVLLNTLRTYIPLVLAGYSGSDLDDVDDLLDDLNDLIDNIPPQVNFNTDLLQVTSVSACVELNADDQDLQYFFAAIFEPFFE